MNVQEYRQEVMDAAKRIGPGLYKVFAVYVVIMAVLSGLGLLLERGAYDWYALAYEYVTAGDLNIPEPSAQANAGVLLSWVLALTGSIVTAGWTAVVLRAVRGEAYSWHDLWSCFPIFWKAVLIMLLRYIFCALASFLFIIPGILLLYNWRLSLFVLAEHPEYGPIQCMRQSRRLMRGERMNLFRLDLSCWMLYGLSIILWYASSGILLLFRMPSLMLLYAVFYNHMVYWKAPGAPEGEV